MNPHAQRKHRVLLAEDNLPDDLLIREVIRLANLPLEVRSVADGEAAVNVIVESAKAESGDIPELLILDLNLPKLEGFEVLEQVRRLERLKGIPVLIVTSSDSPADQQRAAALGARYFRKPPSYDGFLELGAVLRRILTDNGMIE